MPVGQVFLTPTERLRLMILSFLFCEQPIVVKQLIQQLHVSRTTILKDLETGETWLSTRHLILNRRPNYGCLISGGEKEIRTGIVDALYEITGDAFSNRFEDVLEITENQSNKGETAFKRQLAPFLIPLDLQFFNNLVSRVVEENNLAQGESAHILLVFYLAIQVHRIRSKHFLDRVEKKPNYLNDERNFTVATKISGAVQKRYQVDFNGQEISELADILNDSREKISELTLHESSVAGIHEREILKRDFDPEIIAVVEQILELTSTYLHPSLRVDPELILNLANHLTHLYKYPGARIPLKNPLLADLKKEYAYIYKIASDCIDIINQGGKFSLQEDEVGYLTMYLAAGLERMCIPSQSKKRVLVVCNSGGATASLLVSRIRSEFQDINIVAVISNRELASKKKLLDYNVVISTIPLVLNEIPYVLVSPLLNKDDIRKIQALMHTETSPLLVSEKTGQKNSRPVHLSDLITAKTIRLRVEASSWEEVVEKAGEPLLELKAIEPGYIDAMKDVIKQCGPYLVIWPGVALLHARPDEGVNYLSMSLTILKNPVPFGIPGKDPVFMAIVLGAVNNNSHLTSLFELNTLMQKPFIIESLRNATTSYQVRSLISNPLTRIIE
jgi:transcriptional antiterminator/mannitol/fructose-specific phosphotransferase system IIA component (Ntr-type)